MNRKSGLERQKMAEKRKKRRPLASGYRNRRSRKPDKIFVAACLKWKMAFGGSKDKPKRRLRACFLRGARV